MGAAMITRQLQENRESSPGVLLLKKSTNTIMKSLLPWLVLLTPAFLSSCEEQKPARAEIDAPQEAETTPLVPSSNHSRRLQEELGKVSPTEDGWDTEALNDEINKHLKKLKYALSEGDTKTWHAMAEKGIAENHLRPAKLDTDYQNKDLTVRSGEIPSSSSTAPLIDAFEGLLEPLTPFSNKRLYFKIVGINKTASGASTDILVTNFASGRNSGGSLQQNARWQIDWLLENDAPSIEKIIPLTYQECERTANSAGLFDDCASSLLASNSSFENLILPGLDHWAKRLDLTLGFEAVGYQGLSVGDVNGDGIDDLYLSNPGGLPNQLFIRDPATGQLIDRSVESGTDWLDRGRSALFADLDNDGDQDLSILLETDLLLMINDGTGHFKVRNKLKLPGTPFSICAADYDQDGQLDLYVCNYGNLWGGFGDFKSRFPLPYHDADNGGPNALYRNLGDWKFSNVTTEVGLDENNRRWSLAASWEDYDLDGDLDLYVANDFGRNNLYRNDDGRFVDVAADSGVEDISPGMSATWGDFDRDGLPDLYVSNMFSGAGNRITFQEKFQSEASSEVRAHYQRFARGNALFKNTPSKTFSDVSIDAGVNQGRWAWASKFADLNNDGYEDLVVANGFLTQEDTGDL